jgi:hypothetical protein
MILGGERDNLVCLVWFTVGVLSEQDRAVGGGS